MEGGWEQVRNKERERGRERGRGRKINGEWRGKERERGIESGHKECTSHHKSLD